MLYPLAWLCSLPWLQSLSLSLSLSLTEMQDRCHARPKCFRPKSRGDPKKDDIVRLRYQIILVLNGAFSGHVNYLD